jgi:biotin carboxyl carrier protein
MSHMVDDARVLLALLTNSQWRALHVRTQAGEIFIARPGGAPDPIRDVTAARHAPAPAEVDRSSLLTVTAPHVGTIVSTVAADTTVQSGQVIARLELLGEFIDIVSPHPGLVEAVFVRGGAFVEHDTPLLSIVRDTSG